MSIVTVRNGFKYYGTEKIENLALNNINMTVKQGIVFENYI